VYLKHEGVSTVLTLLRKRTIFANFILGRKARTERSSIAALAALHLS